MIALLADPDAVRRASAVALLLLARVLPLTLIAPWLGVRGVPGAARLATAFALTIALMPAAAGEAPPLPLSPALLVLVVRELVLGASFALATSAALYALGWAGGIVDRLRGAGLTRARAGGPLAALHLLAGTVIFVQVGAHRVALGAFADGLALAPLGGPVGAASLRAGLLVSARLGVDLLAFALAFAAPAMLAFLVVELGLGLASRAAPRIAGVFASMPARGALSLAVALVGLAIALPALPALFAASIEAARGALGG